jgi:hypothetical protein
VGERIEFPIFRVHHCPDLASLAFFLCSSNVDELKSVSVHVCSINILFSFQRQEYLFAAWPNSHWTKQKYQSGLSVPFPTK